MTNNFNSNQLINYGKAHGYSPKEIDQVLKAAKDNLVTYGINAGYKGSEINKVLNSQGYSNYNPLTAKANWQNLVPNLKQGAKEFAREMRTMGGVVIEPFVNVSEAPTGQKLDAAKAKFSEAINNDRLRKTAMGAGAGALLGSKVGLIGTAGGAITGGLLGLLGPQNLVDAYLSTYDTTGKDVANVVKSGKGGKELVADMLQGAMYNPFYSGVDALTLGGAKALKGVSKVAGKTVPKTAPMFVQELLQSPEMLDFSRTATNAKQWAKAKNASFMEPVEKLESQLGTDREALVRFIVANEGNISGKNLDAATGLRNALRESEGKAIEYGLLDKASAKANTVAQYAMYKTMDLMPDVLHDDVVKYISTGKPTQRIVEASLNNPNLMAKLDDAITQGKQLYDDNKIAFLTQALTPTLDPKGEVIARAVAKQGPGYFDTYRVIGRATTKDQAKLLEDSLMHQQKQIANITEAIDTVENILEQPGVAEVIRDVNKVPKGYTAINPTKLREGLAQELKLGKNADVAKALRDSNMIEKGAYMIPNVYFKALDNMFSIGKGGTKKDLLNAFKKTVLASPHWFFLNRIGNMTNNAMGGINLRDYADAISNWKKMPQQLKAQTSFNSYVGAGTTGLSDSITKPINKLGRELQRFADSEKGLGDIGRVAGQIASSTSNMFANPIFKAEAAAEATDRYANLIRQAKREAKLRKTTWQEVLKEANKDNTLFNKLNNEVNKDLGDYIGRNYLLPNKVYDMLSVGVPFYRFLTQTGRTTFHQLANHPLAFQSTVMAPARAGKQFSENIIQQYGLDPETYEGGVPYNYDDLTGSVRYIGTEPLPAGAVASDLLSKSSKLNLLSPLFSMGDVLKYKRGEEGWLPSSPGLTEYKRTHGTSKGYEPTTKERWQYALNQFINTVYAPTRMGTGWMREGYNAVTGKPTLSLYDTNMFQTNPLSYAKELPIESVGKWVGIQNRPYYPERKERVTKPSKSQLRNMAKYNRQIEHNTKR